MLTAKEAREIALRSDAEMERHAELITSKVKDLAERGKYSMRLAEANYSDQKYELREGFGVSYTAPALTAFHEDLKKKLMGLGYQWTIEKQMNDPKRALGYIPDGTSNDDPFPSYHIKISW